MTELEILSDPTLTKVTDLTSIIIYYLITRKFGKFKGFPKDIADGINTEILNLNSWVRPVSSTEVGKNLLRNQKVFSSIFYFSIKPYGSRTRYFISGFRIGLKEINLIKDAIVQKFTKVYSRVISPFLLAETIKVCPATLSKPERYSNATK